MTLSNAQIEKLAQELANEIAAKSDRAYKAKLKGDHTHCRVLRFQIRKRIGWLKDLRALTSETTQRSLF